MTSARLLSQQEKTPRCSDIALGCKTQVEGSWCRGNSFYLVPYGLVSLKEWASVISHYFLHLSQLVPLGKCKFMGPLQTEHWDSGLISTRYKCGGQGKTSSVLIHPFLPYSLETRAPTKPGTRQSANPRHLPISTLPYCGITVIHAGITGACQRPESSMVASGVNSNPYACRESSLTQWAISPGSLP